MKKMANCPTDGQIGGRILSSKKNKIFRSKQSGSVDIFVCCLMAIIMAAAAINFTNYILHMHKQTFLDFGVREDGRLFCSADEIYLRDYCIPRRNDHFSPGSRGGFPPAFCQILFAANFNPKDYGFFSCN